MVPLSSDRTLNQICFKSNISSFLIKAFLPILKNKLPFLALYTLLCLPALTWSWRQSSDLGQHPSVPVTSDPTHQTLQAFVWPQISLQPFRWPCNGPCSYTYDLWVYPYDLWPDLWSHLTLQPFLCEIQHVLIGHLLKEVGILMQPEILQPHENVCRKRQKISISNGHIKGCLIEIINFKIGHVRSRVLMTTDKHKIINFIIIKLNKPLSINRSYAGVEHMQYNDCLVNLMS